MTGRELLEEFANDPHYEYYKIIRKITKDLEKQSIRELENKKIEIYMKLEENRNEKTISFHVVIWSILGLVLTSVSVFPLSFDNMYFEAIRYYFFSILLLVSVVSLVLVKPITNIINNSQSFLYKKNVKKTMYYSIKLDCIERALKKKRKKKKKKEKH